MGMKNKQSMAIGRPIRTLHTADSFLAIGLFNTNLSLRLGRYNAETGQYDNANAHTTTINYDETTILHHIVKIIADGLNENDLFIALPCNSGATILLDYKCEPNNPRAYLIIDKNNQKFSFEFPTYKYQIKEKGQVITKIFQSGLTTFSGALEGYVLGIGLDLHLAKLDEAQSQNQYGGYSTGNGYQNGRY